MFNINKYLDKFNKNINSTNLFKEKVVKTIKDITNIDIDIKKIEYKNGLVYLNLTPAKKNKIFIQKDRIINEISKSTENKIIDLL